MEKAGPSVWDCFTDKLIPSEEPSKQNVLIAKKNAYENEEEADIDENQRLQLQQVSNLVEEAYRRVELYNRDFEFYKSQSAAVSERSSCASTTHHATSLPESLDGGHAEVEELKSLPPSLNAALKMNITLQKRFSATVARLEKALKYNLEKQDKLKDEAEEQKLVYRGDRHCGELRNRYHVKVSSFAIPYFRDRFSKPAPMNKDARMKVDQGYLDLYHTKYRTWLTSEKITLLRVVQREYKEILLKEWLSRMRDLERELKDAVELDNDINELKEKMDFCKNHIVFLKNLTPEKVDVPADALIDWDKVSAVAFDGERTAEECSLRWTNEVSPALNSTPFTADEDIKIQTIVEECDKHPDWNTIAEFLGTNRTPLQVMQRWASFIKPALNPARWTAEETEKLVDTINMLRVGSFIPWPQVAKTIQGFSVTQIQARWRYLSLDSLRGPFSVEEDFQLIKGLYLFATDFEKISYYLPGRSKLQVQSRFKRAILPGLVDKPFKLYEDKKIISHSGVHRIRWRTLGSQLPGRHPCEIKLRLYILRFWQDLTGKKVAPPPLFPLTCTKDLDEIRFLQSKLKTKESLRIYLDKLKKSDDEILPLPMMEKKITAKRNDFNHKRIKKLLEKSQENIPCKPNPIRRKGGAKPGPRLSTWPDMALSEYFHPHRVPDYATLRDPEGPECERVYNQLANALQLDVHSEVKEDEKNYLQQFGFTDVDFGLIDSFTKKDSDSCAHAIPMFPPSLTTVGAFRSLLIHKTKLKEMADKSFLLYQITKTQLPNLGTKQKILQVPTPKNNDTSDDIIHRVKPVIEELSARIEDSGDAEANAMKCKRDAATRANIVIHALAKAESEKVEKTGKTSFSLKLPTEDDMERMQMAAEVPCVRSQTEQDDTLKLKSDKILFQRFLSLFLLPSILTSAKMRLDLNVKSQETLWRFENGNIQDEDNEEEEGAIFDLPQPTKSEKWGGKYCKFDIEDLSEIINKAEHDLEENMETEYQSNEEEATTAVPTKKSKKSFRKNTLTGMKRSLVMKKVWEDRWLGKKPMRAPKYTKIKKEPKDEAVRRSARQRKKVPR